MTRPDTQLPPWLDDAWHRLQAQRRADRLPHALLITGQPGVGKQALARDARGESR